MPKPAKPTILHCSFVDWARALKVWIMPVEDLEGGEFAYPERFSYRAEIATQGGEWQPGGEFLESSFVVPLGGLEDEEVLMLRVFALYDGEAGTPDAIEGLESPRAFSTGRRPKETYLRPGAYPHRGPVDSQHLLDDFREFAASNEALYQRISEMSDALQQWVLTNTTELEAGKRAIRRREDETHE